jgi:replicative DNA helicase
MPDDLPADSLKLPPHSLEAEQSVLGGLLLDNDAADRIGDVLSGEDFYSEAHRLIYRHIVQLIGEGKPADVVTVSEALASVQKLDYAGGLAYLGALVQNVPTAANIRHYAGIVRERSILRQLAATAADIAESAYRPLGRDAKQVLDEAEAKVLHIAEQGARGAQHFQEIGKLLAQVVERIETLYNRDDPSDVTGVPTGFSDLDKMTSGLQPGDLVVVAGRPSMGKTAFSINIGENVALDTGLPVAIFSMEMGAAQLALRMIGSVGRLDQHKLRTGRLASEDWDRLATALGRLNEAPIVIDETPALNALEVRSRARRLMKQYGKLGLVIVDYIQLMQASSQGENRATEISEISRSLKSLAKELKVPVIALSQLNRSLEQRPNKRPVMSDLRECVTGDTRVLLADGSRPTVRELVGNTPEVWAVDAGQRLMRAHADKVWEKGMRPVYEVHLASGRRMRATAEHWLLGAQGWVQVRDLRLGARLALARQVPEPAQPAAWREEEVVLLGHLVGEGSYLAHQPLRYTSASEANSTAVRQAAEALGSRVSRHAGRGHWHQLVISGHGDRRHASGVAAWLKRLGIFGQRSHEKRLPPDVFRLGNAQVALLLRHLWATAGCIALRDAGIDGTGRIYFATCSQALADDVAALLLRFGIVARMRGMARRDCRTVYNVDVSGAVDQRRFLDEVGAFGPRLEAARRFRAQLAGAGAHANVDTQPMEVYRRVQAAMRMRGVSQRAMASLRGTAHGGTAHGGASQFRSSPSRDTAAGQARLPDERLLERWAQSELFFDRVTDVVPAGEEPVFDLTVPGPACWLADGIVSHNSGAIEQDADVILFIYRDEVYNPETQEKGTAEIIIGKQRNGPIGMVRLTFLGEYTRFENFATPGSY